MEIFKKNKVFRENKLWLTIGLVAAAVTVGVIAFYGWQGKSTVIETANLNQPGQNRLPVSGEKEIIKRQTLAKGEPDRISIPDRAIEAPVVYITPEQNNQAGHQEALAKGVVHYPGTASPGELGNPYIFGHSSDYFWKPGDYKEIFKPLVDIPLETEIRITNSDGELFIYRVIETKIVGPEEVSVMDQQNYERYLLTLQTSWPIGTALKRYVVVGEMDELATFGPTE